MVYMKKNLGDKMSVKDYAEVKEAILKQEVCPSMRLLWSAGEACEKQMSGLTIVLMSRLQLGKIWER